LVRAGDIVNNGPSRSRSIPEVEAMKRVIPVLVALVACALAGCGSSKSNSTAGTASVPMSKMTKAQMAAMPKAAVTARTSPTSTPAGPVKTVLALAAAPNGNLMYNTSTLVAKAGTVTIDFTNASPIGHNLTVANAAGKVLGATPTFTGGMKALTLDLVAGKYTYYCSVPGHEQAGMKGTLTIT
jgi:plastocyanin